MHQLLPLAMILLLTACGMKGDLYEAPPSTVEATEPVSEPATSETDKRKTIPSTPDPTMSE